MSLGSIGMSVVFCIIEIDDLFFTQIYAIFALQLCAEGYVQEVGGADIMIKSVY